MESKKKKLTQARLKELLDYDPASGIFTWKVRKANRFQVGAKAGWIGKRYRQIRIDGRLYTASRLAWLYMEGYFPVGIEVDHIDRDKSNDKWENLRLVSHSCNAKNISIKAHNKSEITGVCFDNERGRWLAQMANNGKKVLFRRFDTKKEAAVARWEAEKSYKWENCNTTSSAYRYLKTIGAI